MNNKRNRRIAMIIAVLMLTMAFSTTGFAEYGEYSIKAFYRNIRIFVNNEYKQATDVNNKVVEPFIIDGTTYVPLRAISQMLGYDVSFNPSTYRIDITGSGSDPSLQYQLYLKDARIAELEAQLAEKTAYSLDDMQDDLNDDYTRFTRNVSIDEILLKGKTSDIEIRIYVDLKTDSDVANWKDAYDDGDVKSTIQKMVDDVLDQFPDADVEGYVEDDYDNSKLVTFTINSRGVVSLSKSSTTKISSLSDLEDALYDEFRGYYGIEDVIIGGSTSKIEVDILVDDVEWDKLSSSNKTSALNEIIDFIEDAYPNADIDGLVIDVDNTSKTLRTFYN